MQIRKESDSDGLEDQYPQVSFLPGNNYEEVRQIREYRDGDSVRHIYWNQTARRDSLWVKEYEEETKGRAVLFLDLKDGKDKTESALDAFYTLAQALIQGLMRNGFRYTGTAELTEQRIPESRSPRRQKLRGRTGRKYMGWKSGRRISAVSCCVYFTGRWKQTAGKNPFMPRNHRICRELCALH